MIKGEIVLANIKSAKKRIIVNKKNELRNKMFKSMLKTSIRKIESTEGKDKEYAVKLALKYLDRAVSKKILKRNTADRKKSLLMKRYNQAV